MCVGGSLPWGGGSGGTAICKAKAQEEERYIPVPRITHKAMYHGMADCSNSSKPQLGTNEAEQRTYQLLVDVFHDFSHLTKPMDWGGGGAWDGLL